MNSENSSCEDRQCTLCKHEKDEEHMDRCDLCLALDGKPYYEKKKVDLIKEYCKDLRKIVNQLERCKYVCKAGPLENNIAFIALKEIAKRMVEDDEG